MLIKVKTWIKIWTKIHNFKVHAELDQYIFKIMNKKNTWRSLCLNIIP